MAGRGTPQPQGLTAAEPSEIRAATRADAGAIAAIHNEGIEDRVATFETRSKDEPAIRDAMSDWLACVVCERGGEIAGFAKAAPYEDRSHYYDGVGEATVYVARGSRGRGIGGPLLDALAGAARERGLHKLTAKVFAANDASLKLFARAGFRTVGTHERHGQLDGEWLDVVVLERSL